MTKKPFKSQARNNVFNVYRKIREEEGVTQTQYCILKSVVQLTDNKREKKATTVHDCLEVSNKQRAKSYVGWLLVLAIFITVQYCYYYSALLEKHPPNFLDNNISLELETIVNITAVTHNFTNANAFEKFIRAKNRKSYGNITEKSVADFFKARNHKTLEIGSSVGEFNKTTMGKTLKNFVKLDRNILSGERNRNILNKIKEPKMKMMPESTNRKPPCRLNISQFGPILPQITNIKLTMINLLFPDVSIGGHYEPRECRSRHKICILITFRNRDQNLANFLANMHPFLMKQKLDYTIFVIEQSDSYEFNKGRLYNAGFLESQQFGPFDCVIFHDVDLLPLDERILYTCPIMPRHMAASVREIKYNPSFLSMFGGVTAITSVHYKRANGYSNWYWGWGGEDHDMFWRLRAAGLLVMRYNKTIAQYIAMPHNPRTANPLRYQLLFCARRRAKDEGLATVVYRVLNITRYHLYTHIKVDINPTHENPKDVSHHILKYLT